MTKTEKGHGNAVNVDANICLRVNHSRAQQV